MDNRKLANFAAIVLAATGSGNIYPGGFRIRPFRPGFTSCDTCGNPCRHTRCKKCIDKLASEPQPAAEVGR